MLSFENKIKNIVLLSLFTIACLRGREQTTPSIIVKQLRCGSDPSYIKHIYCSLRMRQGLANKLRITGLLQQEINSGTVYVNILQRLNVDSYQTMAYGFVDSFCGILARNKSPFFGSTFSSHQIHSCPYEPEVKIAAENEITILFTGYSRIRTDGVMVADCTCTLITNENHQIIVDTGGPWSQSKLLAALQAKNVNPGDIDFCVSTHAHPDHTGNNNLFLKATHIYGQCVFFGDQYYDHDFKHSPYQIDEGINVIATAGHTPTCVSVLVADNNLCADVAAVTGDLFENEKDIDEPAIWQTVGSADKDLQRRNRALIADQVNLIVPGHGCPFAVTEEMRRKLKLQSQDPAQ